MGIVADEWPVAIVLLAEIRPVTAIGGIAHRVAELEVEGSRCLACSINPVANSVGAIPALTDAIGWVGRLVVELGVGAGVALHHVVAEACIAEVVEQQVEIGFHTFLHIVALVVEVAHAVPAFAGVGIAKLNTKTVGLGLCLAVVIIGANIGGIHGIGHALIGFRREPKPAVIALAVVDDNVGNGADAVSLECLDERPKLLLCAKRRTVIGEPVEIVITHAGAATVSTLW